MNSLAVRRYHVELGIVLAATAALWLGAPRGQAAGAVPMPEPTPEAIDDVPAVVTQPQAPGHGSCDASAVRAVLVRGRALHDGKPMHPAHIRLLMERASYELDTDATGRFELRIPRGGLRDAALCELPRRVGRFTGDHTVIDYRMSLE